MKQNFTKSILKTLFGIMFYLLIPWDALAQTKVTGTVVDKLNNPLPGISVYEKGTKNGVTTNGDGQYNITLSKVGATLTFRMVGYVMKEVPSNGKNVVNITLLEDNQTLNEVVLVGYQSISRKKATGAIATVKGKAIENTPYASFDQMLQGRVAGLTSLGTSGEPGAKSVVNIRGSNSISQGGNSYPLYVIDGVIFDVNDMPNSYGSNPLSAINPNDIESIDVLKDASASAIYGSRGANGVIMVKTKRGQPGMPPQFNVNFYQGISDSPTLRNIMTGTKERQLKMALLYASKNKQINDISMFLTDSLNTAFNNNTDWQDLFVRSARITNADISMTGSEGKSQYRFSTGFYNEQGVMRGFSLRRISPKLYLSLNPGRKINVTFDISPSFIKQRHGVGNGSSFPFGTQNFPSSFWKVSEAQKNTYQGNTDNLDEDQTVTLLSNVKVTDTIAKNLTITSSFSSTYNHNRRDWLISKLVSNGQGDRAYNSDVLTNVWEIENYINWNKNFGEHAVSVVAGQEAQEQSNKRTDAYGLNVSSNTISGIAPGNNLFASTYMETRKRLGWFGRLSYDYKGRYLFSASYRRDASSRYNANQRWANFYSVSGGWVISDEPFFEKIKNTVNLFKFRGSYGVTGNDPASYYGQYQTYSTDGTYYNSSFGVDNAATATTYNGVTVNIPSYNGFAASKNVTWETYPQINIGADIGLFKDRINLAFDWYSRDANDMYYQNALAPVTSGYQFYSGNLVSLRNTGLEFTLNTNNLSPSSKFQWQTTFVLGLNDNYITKLPNGGRDLIVGAPWAQQTLTVGQPVFTYKVYKVDGVYQTDAEVPTDPLTGRKLTFNGTPLKAGDQIVIDQNGDYNIDLNDKISYGDPNSRITGGLTNSFTYKGFSVTVLCTFVKGRNVWNGYTADRLLAGEGNPAIGWGSIAGPAALGNVGYWEKEGMDAVFGTLTNSNNGERFGLQNSTFVENGSFFKVKNISLGYSFAQKIIQRLNVKALRVYGMIDNVYMYTKSTLPDPEFVDFTGFSDGTGFPPAKKFTLGLNVTF